MITVLVKGLLLLTHLDTRIKHIAQRGKVKVATLQANRLSYKGTK